MNPSKHSQKLKAEADDLLKKRGIETLLQKYGEVTYAGSYALDLMMWRDIDLHITIDTIDEMMDLAKEFARFDDALRVKFGKNLHVKTPSFPRGLYLGIVLGTYETNWKFDIWGVEQEEIKRRREEREKIIKALTDETRELILQAKYQLLTPEGRSLPLSSHFVYQAVLFDHMRDLTEIVESVKKSCSGYRTTD